MKIMKCNRCKGTDVMRDAWAVWDKDEQDWGLGSVFDQGYCDTCDGETTIDEEEVADDHLICR